MPEQLPEGPLTPLLLRGLRSDCPPIESVDDFLALMFDSLSNGSYRRLMQHRRSQAYFIMVKNHRRLHRTVLIPVSGSIAAPLIAKAEENTAHSLLELNGSGYRLAGEGRSKVIKRFRTQHRTDLNRPLYADTAHIRSID